MGTAGLGAISPGSVPLSRSTPGWRHLLLRPPRGAQDPAGRHGGAHWAGGRGRRWRKHGPTWSGAAATGAPAVLSLPVHRLARQRLTLGYGDHGRRQRLEDPRTAPLRAVVLSDGPGPPVVHQGCAGGSAGADRVPVDRPDAPATSPRLRATPRPAAGLAALPAGWARGGRRRIGRGRDIRLRGGRLKYCGPRCVRRLWVRIRNGRPRG